MAEFWQDVALAAVFGVFAYAVVDALARLSKEVRDMRLQLGAIAEGRPPESTKPKELVHDHHSEGDEFASVTAKAQKAWG
jgi:hypothetical protein